MDGMSRELALIFGAPSAGQHRGGFPTENLSASRITPQTGAIGLVTVLAFFAARPRRKDRNVGRYARPKA